jgi:nucleotide-binding universal stress UspA family protein
MVRIMEQRNAPGRRIVVGVDGSGPSRQALRWAMRQAERTGSSVQAVIAWHFPAAAVGYGWAPVLPAEAMDWQEMAAKQLSGAIADEVDPASRVQVDMRVVEGNAAQVLLELAEGAELLVVGSRGHGGFAEALLGSVGQHCVHHARCPVVVIRGR